MHELSIAMDLVEQLTEVVRKENASEVLEINVVMGAMCGVEKVPFEFAFPEAAKNTPLEGAMLNIEEVPLIIKCNDCGIETELDEFAMVCPGCSSFSIVIVKGKEFLVKSMEVK